MTKTRTITVSGRNCGICGAEEGLPHHDQEYRLLVVALETHNGKLHCQPCLEGSQALENPAQYALDKAARLQTEFWEALRELEGEIGNDVDDNRDLAGLTVEDLKDDDDDEEEDEECTCGERSWYGPEHDTACPLAGKPRTQEAR